MKKSLLSKLLLGMTSLIFVGCSMTLRVVPYEYNSENSLSVKGIYIDSTNFKKNQERFYKFFQKDIDFIYRK